jgi:hypothetical protein
MILWVQDIIRVKIVESLLNQQENMPAIRIIEVIYCHLFMIHHSKKTVIATTTSILNSKPTKHSISIVTIFLVKSMKSIKPQSQTESEVEVFKL